MKKTKFIIGISSFIILLIVINGCAKTSIPIEPQEKITPKDTKTEKQKTLASPIKLDLSISPINEEKFAEVTLTVKSERNVQDISGKIILPEAYELVDGNLEWQTDLEANEPEEFKLKVKAVKEGDWVIKATTEDNSISAQLVTKIDESQRHGVYINESEFYKDRVRSWSACYGFECFTPTERRGQSSIDYFKSLNLTDDFIYIIMQFDALGGDPTVDQMNLLASDNITLFEYHGDHSYFARVPKTILESKSYDFVRWIGVAENSSWKVERNLRNKTFGKNCTGDIQLDINFYQELKDIPDYNTKKELIMNLSIKMIGEYREIMSVNASVINIYKIATFNFVQRISVVEEVQLLREVLPKALKDPLESIKCFD